VNDFSVLWQNRAPSFVSAPKPLPTPEKADAAKFPAHKRGQLLVKRSLVTCAEKTEGSRLGQKRKIGKMKKGRGNDTSCTLEQVLDVKLVTSLCAGTRLAGLTSFWEVLWPTRIYGSG